MTETSEKLEPVKKAVRDMLEVHARLLAIAMDDPAFDLNWRGASDKLLMAATTIDRYCAELTRPAPNAFIEALTKIKPLLEKGLLYGTEGAIAVCEAALTSPPSPAPDALREALKFYADEQRYNYDETCCHAPVRGWLADKKRANESTEDVLMDHGERARAALASLPTPAPDALREALTAIQRHTIDHSFFNIDQAGQALMYIEDICRAALASPLASEKDLALVNAGAQISDLEMALEEIRMIASPDHHSELWAKSKMDVHRLCDAALLAASRRASEKEADGWKDADADSVSHRPWVKVTKECPLPDDLKVGDEVRGHGQGPVYKLTAQNFPVNRSAKARITAYRRASGGA